MTKQTFRCPHCNNSSTFEVESSVSLYPGTPGKNKHHQTWRCDVCGNLTYKIIDKKRIGRGMYVPPDIKATEEFQYPFGFLSIEPTLPDPIKDYYLEAYNCFKIGSLKAAAAMCRATISALCDDKNAIGQDLKERINDLPLSGRLKRVAKDIKWIGDKTLHNEIDWAQAKWDKKTVEEMLGFIDRIVDDIYTQERKTQEFNTAVSKAGVIIKKKSKP